MIVVTLSLSRPPRRVTHFSVRQFKVKDIGIPWYQTCSILSGGPKLNASMEIRQSSCTQIRPNQKTGKKSRVYTVKDAGPKTFEWNPKMMAFERYLSTSRSFSFGYPSKWICRASPASVLFVRIWESRPHVADVDTVQDSLCESCISKYLKHIIYFIQIQTQEFEEEKKFEKGNMNISNE